MHEELLSEQELEIEQLNAHYTELLDLAGLSEEQMVALKAKQAEKLAAIDKKYADESLAKVQTDNQKKLAAQQALFQGLGELAMATSELFAGEAERIAGFPRLRRWRRLRLIRLRPCQPDARFRGGGRGGGPSGSVRGGCGVRGGPCPHPGEREEGEGLADHRARSASEGNGRLDGSAR